MKLELTHGSVPQPTLSAFARRLSLAKRAYTTRRVPVAEMAQLLEGADLQPRAGDLLLARVDRIGKHAFLESVASRKSTLFVGDEIVVAYGARYAPDQFEALVPTTLAPCQLVAGGGIAASVTDRHAAVATATDITPLGLLADSRGERLNLARHALCHVPTVAVRPTTIASIGTSMNAGKTTSAAYLIRGLTRAGLRVGAAKITGTGAGGDPGLFRDAGAVSVFDFTDAGHASTYLLDLDALHDVMERLLSQLTAQHVDVIVIEIADGLFQRETAQLLRSPTFKNAIDGVVFSAGDAMGAFAGVQWLRECGLPVLALSGALTRSPMARREIHAATQLPVMGLAELAHAENARRLIEAAAAGLDFMVAA